MRLQSFFAYLCIVGFAGPVGIAEAQSRNVACPPFQSFNETRAFTVSVPARAILAGAPSPYSPEFTYGTGTIFQSQLGNSSAAYSFQTIISADGLMGLQSPWMSADCREIASVAPPADTTWSSLITISGNGGTPTWLYHAEECELDESARPPVRIVEGGDDAVRTASVSCESGGGGGGGGGEGQGTQYCLYLDYYDGDGNFLYSELVSCWYAT